MMYEEFTSRLEGHALPTIAEYTEIIEPVYNYHPALNVGNPKDKCAELYRNFGLGIFRAMREVADTTACMEQENNRLRRAADEARKSFEESNRKYLDYCREIREMWGGAGNNGK